MKTGTPAKGFPKGMEWVNGVLDNVPAMKCWNERTIRDAHRRDEPAFAGTPRYRGLRARRVVGVFEEEMVQQRSGAVRFFLLLPGTRNTEGAL